MNHDVSIDLDSEIDAPHDVDTLLGFDVNDFESTTYYAIFNDPDAPELANVVETLRELITETPIYEDESLERTIRHARLTNEDRERGVAADGQLRSPVIIKEQTTLRTPYKIVNYR